jgi:hypothetical protein
LSMVCSFPSFCRAFAQKVRVGMQQLQAAQQLQATPAAASHHVCCTVCE